MLLINVLAVSGLIFNLLLAEAEGDAPSIKKLQNEATRSKEALTHQTKRVDNLHRAYVRLQSENKQLAAKLKNIEAVVNKLGSSKPAQLVNNQKEQYMNTMNSLARQVAMQQLIMEEKIRSDGNSGIKQVRSIRHGTKAYYSQTVVAGAPGSAHDHSNYERTVGLGELGVVMNGVDFRTRHNDYRLVQPSTSSHNFHSTQFIEYPPVPPEVLNKGTVQEQIREMRMFFKAFHSQNPGLRDYRPYFPAVLCYLEGAWMYPNPSGKIDEPFHSTRHKIDARNWFDLQEKIWFTAYNGRKDKSENYAFLPTTIVNFTAEGPIYAQWNYRILCHKLKNDLPTRSMRVLDDLATRMENKWTVAELKNRRQARFQMGPFPYWNHKDRVISPGAQLDKLMYEIPGKNNYGAVMNDSNRYETMREVTKSTYLNAAYYNRHFDADKGAMGSSRRRRGYSDDFLFTALTTHPQVVPRGVKQCYGKRGCKYVYQRVSYALPLEIIYLNPLQSWNPFNFTYHDRSYEPRDNGRNGGFSPKRALNGTSRIYYYWTPKNFYNGAPLGVGSSPADTVRGSLGVLAPDGDVKSVASSGIKILLDTIAGVGKIRQRYPIFPVHQEGSHEWIHMEALKEIVYNPTRFGKLIPDGSLSTISKTPSSRSESSINMYTDVGAIPFPHDHTFTLSDDQLKLLKLGNTVTVETDETGGHSHSIKIKVSSFVKNQMKFSMASCDDRPTCPDGHKSVLQDV